MKVSRIYLGCMGFGDVERWVHQWVLTEENIQPVIKKALELGINFFDTANVYSIGASEEILGRARKIGAIPYRPLASGRLTRDGSSESTLRSETDRGAKGKYDATADTDRLVVERVAETAEKVGYRALSLPLPSCNRRNR